MKDKDFELYLLDYGKSPVEEHKITSFKKTNLPKITRKEMKRMIEEFDMEDQLMNEWQKNRENGTG